MIRKFGGLAIVGSIVLAVMLAITPRADWLSTGLSLVAVLTFAGVFMIPTVRKAALHNRRAAFIGGVGVIIVATCILLVGIFSGSLLSPELIAGGFSSLLLAGFMLTQLPRISANVESAIEAQKVAESVRPSLPSFRPLPEVERSLGEIWEQKASLVRIVGPWLLAFCAAYILFETIVFRGALKDHQNLALPLSLFLLMLLIVVFFSLVTAAIQWTRFLATRREPSWFELSGKALWGWAWRCLIFGPIFTRANNQIDIWVRSHVHGAPQWELQLIDKLVLLAILVLASPFALGLPAVAINEPSKATEARVKGLRLAGRRYYTGFAIIVLPYVTASCLIDSASEYQPSPSAQAVLAFIWVMLLFATAIVGITYITRVYLRGASIAGTIGR